MVRAFSERLAALTADWVRVGFVQGNFNSDNCLVGGRTMDYGPFGFIERFQVPNDASTALACIVSIARTSQGTFLDFSE